MSPVLSCITNKTPYELTNELQANATRCTDDSVEDCHNDFQSDFRVELINEVHLYTKTRYCTYPDICYGDDRTVRE